MNEEKSILMELKKMFHHIKRNLNNKFGNMHETILTPVQMMLLGYIIENKEKDVFQRDIETAFNIRRSTATNLIKEIESKGFIRREAAKNDARLKKIILTEKSKKMDDTINEKINLLDEKIKKEISNEELEMFFGVIDKIKKNMEEK